MFKQIKQYTHWLHGQWPAGQVEQYPLIDENGLTNIDGCYVVGDLTGIPLLKFASQSGAKAVTHMHADSAFKQRKVSREVFDLIIIGGGISGYAAALEAKKQQLNFVLIEANEPFSTIANFPKEKAIFTYPNEFTPLSELQFSDKAVSKEALLTELHQRLATDNIEWRHEKVNEVKKIGNLFNIDIAQDEPLQAHRVVIAIGRSGNYRQLNVAGENLDKVNNRLIDAKDYQHKNLLIVGGGDSALEAAIATLNAGASVTISYRRSDFSRAKQANVERVQQLVADGQITLQMNSSVSQINQDNVELNIASGSCTLANDSVLLMLGREAPLDFFRRSKIKLSGESSNLGWFYFFSFMVLVAAIYDWKNFGWLNNLWSQSSFPDQIPALIGGLGEWWQGQVNDRSTFIGTVVVSMKSRSFYYTLVYTSLIGYFGWQRIKRRKTPYVTVQTVTLFLVQFLPLFIIPEILLPWLGYVGAFNSGLGLSIADSLFPSYISAADLAAKNWPSWGHPRAYWHAYGFILAWPLNVYNVFTPTPMMGWLVISFVQTFIIIPALIYKYGKGAYCGWICSCGALAETLGDQQRHKMPRGKGWNNFNMVGQVVLLVAFILLFIRIGGWLMPESWMHQSFDLLLKGDNDKYQLVNALSWKWTVDILFGGIFGVGLYFKYSGRVWCRFFCPLAALMHIYARFSRYAIVADKDKCISCNQCTSVCHQGIDVMSFANKGKPMTDPQCVRCSACVSTCPTGTLSFAEIDRQSAKVIRLGTLAASPVQIVEQQEKK
ncbi:MAG: NAD(P)-binding domain-containing protein [Psychrobium sp.]|nr:NAD(P)-binding domain-containing protein [Psychrobium sp.]